MSTSTPWPPAADLVLPDDHTDAVLLGRVHDPSVGGPLVVTVRGGAVVDLTATFPTTVDVAEHAQPAAAVRAAEGPVVGSVADLLATTPPELRCDRPWFVSPIDLQAVKAAGVTFAVSMLERVIEERAGGDPTAAQAVRAVLTDVIGTDLSQVRPGSSEAMRLKEALVADGAWSQYLEVGLGEHAEIFTKAPAMATVGVATDVGIRPDSSWNNPEPEVVLLVSSSGRIVGATLGNDVNLRDFEGRSALLLGEAKDNNASASLGPFVRLLDDGFTLEDVRATEVSLRVDGADGFVMEGSSTMRQISRDPVDLVGQLLGPTHQYPDGTVLYLGTLFAPAQDRGEPGKGFTHHVDDVVTIASPRLGTLVNRVRTSDRCEPWTFGLSALMRNLAERGLLDRGR